MIILLLLALVFAISCGGIYYAHKYDKFWLVVISAPLMNLSFLCFFIVLGYDIVMWVKHHVVIV